jgi:hypothetical protein
MTLKLLVAAALGLAFSSAGSTSQIRYASPLPDEDMGAEINALYNSLPPTGGEIVVEQSASFAIPIVFGTKDKPVLLVGLPADIVTLTYTGAGVAMTFDYGTGHRMGHGMRDLTLTGPGHSSDTTGVMFGGVNGAEGLDFRDFKIQGFGINLQMGSNTWQAYFQQGMVRDGGMNLLLPSGLSQAGEQITFNHVTFADAPAPHTNSVWIQGQSQEVVFTDCSFDQAQLRVGNGGGSGAQVVVRGCHFENPNYADPESVNYDHIVVDKSAGNYLRLTDSYFIQGAPNNGPKQFLTARGGRVQMSGIGMYTPAGAPLSHFEVLWNDAAMDMYGFDDLSGNLTGSICSKGW